MLSGCAGGAAGVAVSEPVPSTPQAPTQAVPSATPTPAALVPVDPAAYAAVEIGEGVVFVSPSRNLRCGILAMDAEHLWGCRIEQKDWEFSATDPTDPCHDSQVPCGWGIEAIGAEQPHPRTRGDVAFESEYREDSAVLADGRSITLGEVTCSSLDEAITCEHATSGHGFAISEARNEIW